MESRVTYIQLCKSLDYFLVALVVYLRGDVVRVTYEGNSSQGGV